MLKNLRQRVDLFNFLRRDIGTKQVHLSLSNWTVNHGKPQEKYEKKRLV